MKFKNKAFTRIASVGLICLMTNQYSFGQGSEPKEYESKLKVTSDKDKETNKKRTLDDIRSKLKLNDSQGASEGMVGGMSSGMGGEGGMGGPGMGGGYGGPGGGMGAAPSEKQLLGQLIQRLRQRLNTPSDNREKTEKQLRAALQQYFEADMGERVKEFDKVKARVTEMESKLQRRLDSEEDIIELQLKQILHKADGLDFNVPSGSVDGYGGYGGGYGGGMGAPGGMAMGGMAGPGSGIGSPDGGYGGMGAGDGPGMGMGPGGGMGAGGGMAGPGGYHGGYGSGGEDAGGYGLGGGRGGMLGAENSLPLVGYDASFGFTRVQRLDMSELTDDDPLKKYVTENSSIDEMDAYTDQEKMIKILLAFHQFESRFKHLPRSENRRTASEPPHSWRVAILPLLGYADLYNEYQFDQPWDSDENLKLAAKMPAIYRSTETRIKDTTPFKMLVGGGAFDSGVAPARFADITDGSSNTIALIAFADEVLWTQPEDVKYSTAEALPARAKSGLVGMADGFVRAFINIDPVSLNAAITRSGGEPIRIESSK